jgi:hypothetical protein
VGIVIVVLGRGAVLATDEGASPWSGDSRETASPPPVTMPGSVPETVGGAWSYGPETPFAFTRFDGGYSPYDGKIYFLGGRLSDGSTDGSVWSFDPRTGAWADTGDDLQIPISNYQVSLYENQNGPMLLALCGRKETAPTDSAVLQRHCAGRGLYLPTSTTRAA